MFVHEDPAFDGLLRIVADKQRLAVAMVEKDYWVIHSLWALQAQGLEVWFKGGTSLSKGFGLIQRFSEDLDLKIEPGELSALPVITSWNKDSAGALASRERHYRALGAALRIPGATVHLQQPVPGGKWRGANYEVRYPGKHLGALPRELSPYVLLEVGRARVTPFLSVDMRALIHDELQGLGQLADFDDNQPRSVRCVHPLVTLLEKLDALQKRVPDLAVAPARFVRHFEDAAHIIDAAGRGGLPPLSEYGDVDALARTMLEDKSLARIPHATDPAFSPTMDARWADVRAAHAAIGPMFWGPRVTIDDCGTRIRAWLQVTLPS